MAIKLCGIYKITNHKDGIYIGQSKDIINRSRVYSNCSCKSQAKVYNSIKKYGWSNHNLEIICLCGEDELDRLEAYYIQLYNTFNTSHGLNLLSGGNSLRKHSDESKLKMSNSRKGVKLSEAHKDKLKGKRGHQNYIRTDDHKKKLSIPKTQETKDKIRNSKIGKNHSIEHKKAQSEGRRNMSEEMKDKYRKPWTEARWQAYYKTKNK